MTSRMFMAMIWTVGLLAACLLPAAWLNLNEHNYFGFTFIDKVVHCALFAGFGFFWTLVSRSQKAATWVLVTGFVLAVATEVGQGLPMIHRDPDFYDGLADIAGLLLGSGLAQILSRWSMAWRGRLIAEEV